MASEEALRNLKNGQSTWKEYLKQKNDFIDLTFANLNNWDLRDITFNNCDLSGAILIGANLDGSLFSESILNGTDFSNSSLLNCTFLNLKATRINLKGTIVRNSIFENFECRDSKFKETIFEENKFIKSIISNCEFHFTILRKNDFSNVKHGNILFNSVVAEQSTFFHCIINNIEYQKSNIIAEKYSRTDLNDVKYFSGNFFNNEISECKVSNLIFEESSVQELDLSHSVIKSLKIESINPGTAILLNTSFISCIWPNQIGRVSLFGKYIPSPFLLAQPIQDISGVSPILIREIGDAQYLLALCKRKRSLIGKLILRVWGISSSFGQSLSRLTLFSILIIIFHTLIILMCKSELFGWHLPNISLFLIEFKKICFVFLGLGDYKFLSDMFLERITILSIRLFGFLCLGIWISIASNKFNKLYS